METWIRGLYFLAAVFGLGVTAVDMLGLLGHDDDAGDGHDGDGHDGDTGPHGHSQHGPANHGPANHGHSHQGPVDHGHAQLGHADSADQAGGIDTVEGADDVDADGSQDHGDSNEAHQTLDQGASGRAWAVSHRGDAASLLTTLAYLRQVVYFSLGFGPVGIMALVSGSQPMGSLMWAVPSGLVSMFLARSFFRFQQRDVDSSVQDKDLFFASATVIVPIASHQMGKVRVRLGRGAVERYARAEHAGDALLKGEEVIVTRIGGDCVFVERPAQLEAHASSG